MSLEQNKKLTEIQDEVNEVNNLQMDSLKINNQTQIGQSSHILNLNEDCLLEILKYLNFVDNVQLLMTCKRFEKMFGLYYKNQVKELDSFKHIPEKPNVPLLASLDEKNLEKVLQNIGLYIESFILGKNMLADLQFTPKLKHIWKYCHNLNNLKLENIPITNDDILYWKNLNKLRKLTLSHGVIDDDDLAENLSEISTIDYLDVSHSYNLTGVHIGKFTNLKSLILNDCFKIEPSHFINIFSNLTKIKELNIDNCRLLNSEALQALVANLNELEILTISTDCQTNEFYKISKLKNLRSCHIKFFQMDYIKKVLKKLAEDKAQDLIYLGIENCIPFAHIELDEQSFYIITQFTNLKQLNIKNFWLSDTFLENLSILKDLKILKIQGMTEMFENHITFEDHRSLNSALIKFIQKSSQIDCIEFCWARSIDEDFIVRIAEVLQVENRIEPLSLVICGASLLGIIDPTFFVIKNVLKIYNYDHEYKDINCELRQSFFKS